MIVFRVGHRMGARTARKRVLVVGGAGPLARLDGWLQQNGTDPLFVQHLGEAAAMLREASGGIDALLTALSLDSVDELASMSQIVTEHPDLPVLLLTAEVSPEPIVNALRAGTIELCPLTGPGELQRALTRSTLLHRLRRKLDSTDLIKATRLSQMLGESRLMRALFQLIKRVAQSDVSVLITGETGTGKELVAEAIHRFSPRSRKPFVTVNCAAMPEALLESELFGHSRGAFTDAVVAHTGLLVHAEGGTVLLDEIGDMPAGLQPKLLRVLQQRQVRPVGSNREVAVDARIIAATNKDLEREVRRNRFREDLYFRINVIEIEVPPLRRRDDDVLHLAQEFVRRASARQGKEVTGITPRAAEKMARYGWPGNVRELQNCIERAVALTHLPQITVEDLPQQIRRKTTTGLHQAIAPEEVLSMVEVEQRHIRDVLQRCRGNKRMAADLLGVDRKTLYRKLNRFSIV